MMPRHLIAAAAVGAALLGCASGGSYSSSPVVNIVDNGATQIERTADGSIRDSLPAPPAQAFRAVTAAYSSLGVTPTLYDPNGMTVGVQNLRVARRFNGKPARTYFDCGNGFTGPRADDWQLIVGVVSRILPSSQGGTARVETRAVAFGQDPAGGGERISCESTGALEHEVAVTAQKSLAAKPTG